MRDEETMRQPPRGLGLPLAAITVVAVLAAAAGGAIVVRAQPGSPPTFDLTRGVLVSNRANLQVCVTTEPSDPTGVATAVGRVRAAHARLNDDERFRAAGYATPPWQVAPSCPQPGRLLESGQRHVKAGGSYGLGTETSNPSPFRLFVYVVPASEIARRFGPLPFHFASQEVFCERQSCATVTTALYVDAATLLDEPRLAAELEQALGLRPPFPDGVKPSTVKEIK